MKTPRLLLAGILLGAGIGRPALAQSLDPTFAPASVLASGTVFSVAEQPDGKRVVAGNFARVNGTSAVNLARFDAAGGLDAAFQQNVGVTVSAYRPRVLANGQILVISLGGSPIAAGGLTRPSVLRLNANGTGDASFNPGTGATTTANSGAVYVDDMLPLPNGQTVVVGPFTYFNGVPANRIVRLTAAGAVDPTFRPGLGASGEIETVIGLPNGQLLIGGLFNDYDGRPAGGLARLNADGSLDATFTSPFDNQSDVINLVAQPDGKVLVAGGLYATGSGTQGQGLARLLPSGAIDPSFSPPATLDEYSVYSYLSDAVQLQPDGKIVLLAASGVAGTGAPEVARLNANGTIDGTFQTSSGPNSLPYSLTLLANGQVLVGGYFTRFGNLTDRSLVLLTSTGALDPSFQPLIQATGAVNAVARQADGKLVVGGNFSEINGQTVRRLARFNANGTLDAAFAPPATLAAAVTSLVLQPDGRVLAIANGAVQRYLGSGALDNSFNAVANGLSPRGLVLQPDGRILVGTRSTVRRLLVDGSLDQSFSASASGISVVQALALQPNGKVLVAGTSPAGTGPLVQTLVRLESTGAVDPSFTGREFVNASSNFGLNSLAVQSDGKILVAGQFSAYGSTARTNLARLNADGTLDAGFVPPALTGALNKVLVQPNNRVLLGGQFAGAGLPSNLARLLPTGQADATFGTTAAPNGAVNDLLIEPDGKIVLGGSFTTVNGQPYQALARITAPFVLHVAAPRAVADRTEAWPVPARTTLFVVPAPNAHAQALDLLDALGRPVRHQALAANAPAAVSVADLPAGTYLLRVTYAEGAVVRRIQVQ